MEREWTVTRMWRVKAPTAQDAFEATSATLCTKAWASEIFKAKNGFIKGPNVVKEKKCQLNSSKR